MKRGRRSERHEVKADVVLLATADWANPFWTNKQHVAVELARRGHRVLYVDSLGLRRPSASQHDFGRILKRLVRGLRDAWAQMLSQQDGGSVEHIRGVA